MPSDIIITGVFVHLILIYSIFDIFYTSPIVQNVNPYPISNNTAPADRLIVFSADGLRWDTFHKHPDLSPYLHTIINERKGVFGISQSHVPTESRPGHVAIFAGFTEDVSAVAKGWKRNPVPFDSIFNRSDEAYIWGSPDITMLFDHHAHVKSFSYSESDEDFNSDNAYKLDEWVFQKFESTLLTMQKQNELSQPRTIYFLHLLGLDTNGHGNKPHSQQYKDNLKFVDKGVKRVVEIIEEIFPDQKSAYVFTADHGMTDWGSHGGGSDDEIMTPFVAWGSGLAKGGQMRVLSQVDLAPLMSALLGISIPVNSVGILPTHVLSVTPMYIFKAAYSNFLQLREQVLALREEKSKRLWFKEYDLFGGHALTALETQMLKLAKLGRYTSAATLFVENANLIRDSIFYYHRYDRFVLSIAISATFIGWIALVLTSLLAENVTIWSRKSLFPNKYYQIILAFLFVYGMYCHFSWSKIIYIMLPPFLFSLVENISGISRKLLGNLKLLLNDYKTTSYSFLALPLVGLFGLCIFLFICVMVFMDRRLLSAVFLLLIAVPSLYPQNSIIQEWTRHWRILCISMMPFPFFSTVGQYETPLLCFISPFLAALLLSKYEIFQIKLPKYLPGAFTAVAFLIFMTSYFFEQTPLIIKCICWLTLPIALMIPITINNNMILRLLTFLGTLYVPYSLLSIAYESLFLLIFIPILLLFLRFEYAYLCDAEFIRLSPERLTTSQNKLSWNDFRKSVICVAFVLSALFGTGNFASINSFNPSTLSRFISVFSPFTMASLLIAKLLIPLLMISLVFASILRFEKTAIHKLSFLVLIITDLMSMCFFHQLKDEGSWLEIGLSISQYLVSMFMSVALLILILLSSKLMTVHLLIQPKSKGDASLS